MAEILSPGVFIQEETPKVRTILDADTAVCAMSLVTEKGPIGVDEATTTFDEWVRIYGRAISASKSFAMVEQFYNNGGRKLYTNRIVHYTDNTNPATKISAAAHVDLADSGATNVLDIDGKYDGAYGNGLDIVISNATNGVTTNFNLAVVESGVTLEIFPNLVNDNTSLNDAATVINGLGGSNWIKATFVAAGLGRPVNGTFSMTTGDDGLTGLADSDYIGSAAGGTGNFAFDGINDIRIILAPDNTAAAVQTALFDYADITRNRSMFSIPSIPEGLDTNGAITYVKTTAALKNRGEVGAVYWPNVLIPNPNKTAYGNTENITLQVSAVMAGLYTRTDSARVGGVYDEPAGTERGIPRGIVGLELNETQQRGKRNLLYPENINPLWKPNGTPIIVDGSRVLDRTQNFASVAQRRGVTFIEQSVEDGLLVFVHRANNPETREEVSNTIRAFLLVQFRQGAFRGDTPGTSFFVDVSDDINPPTEVNLGRLNVRIGLATNRPAEFIILKFSQDLRDLQAELAASS